MTQLAVIITDNPSMNSTASLAEVQNSKLANIGIVTVGIGTYLNLYELSAMASYPYNKNMFQVNTARNMTQFADPIRRIICSSELN